jgi:hypothetical protein
MEHLVQTPEHSESDNGVDGLSAIAKMSCQDFQATHKIPQIGLQSQRPITISADGFPGLMITKT